MAINPSIRINWDTGEGRLELGDRFSQADALFRSDVLSDIAGQANALYEEACSDLFPGMNARLQRFQNQHRQHQTATLVGQTIKAAKALRNGDVALELGDGRVVVFAATDEDVKICTTPSMAAAIRYAADCPTDCYEKLPSKHDIKKLAKDGVQEGRLVEAGVAQAA